MSLNDLSPVMLVGLLALAAIEFGLLIFAVVDWAKRAPDQFNGNRWLWLVLILFVNIVGPIVYLLAGRRPAPAQMPAASAPSATRAQTAADALYGPGEAVPAVAESPDPAAGADGTGAGELP